jgi:hypothetical protein
MQRSGDGLPSGQRQRRSPPYDSIGMPNRRGTKLQDAHEAIVVMGAERSLSLLFDRDDISMLSASGQSLWAGCDAKPLRANYPLKRLCLADAGLGLDASDNLDWER